MNCRSNRHRWLVWLTLWVFGLAALAPAISRALWAAEHSAASAHTVVVPDFLADSRQNHMGPHARPHAQEADGHAVHHGHGHPDVREDKGREGHGSYDGHDGHGSHGGHQSHEGYGSHDALAHLDHCTLCVVMAHLPPVTGFPVTTPVVAFNDIQPAPPVQADLAQRHILSTLSRGPPAVPAASLTRAA